MWAAAGAYDRLAASISKSKGPLGSQADEDLTLLEVAFKYSIDGSAVVLLIDLFHLL